MDSHEAPAATAPPARRPGALPRAYAFLVSPKLAISLLVAVLGCCVVGVTVFSPERAWTLIFTTLWFNGLLALLAVSSAAAFFTRIWRRRLTLVSAGMIVFHVSFAALLGGVVFHSLFYFKGVLRLTEGETLPNGELASYDLAEHGRFFDFARLRGETTLEEMHLRYEVDGKKKGPAYEVSVGGEGARTTEIIYITRNLEHDDVRYLVTKEGYSIAVFIHDKQGRQLYGAWVPLQSLARGENEYLYTTGTQHEPGVFPFPPAPETSLLLLQVQYEPDRELERAGKVRFYTRRVDGTDADPGQAMGQVAVGGAPLDAGEYLLEAREVRYWAGMDVRHDPGLMVILSSLWAGLGGMVMTFVGRIRQDGARKGKGNP